MSQRRSKNPMDYVARTRLTEVQQAYVAKLAKDENVSFAAALRRLVEERRVQDADLSK